MYVYMSTQQQANSKENRDMVKMLRISEDTHEKLTDLGKKNESYDEIIIRLIDFYNENYQGGSSSKHKK